jgi:hypothetical protein
LGSLALIGRFCGELGTGGVTFAFMFALAILTPDTWALVAVGLIQAAILFLTICAITRQTASAENSERAWVMGEIEWDQKKLPDGKAFVVEGDGSEGKSTGIWITLVCKNEGKSPGWIYEKRMKFELVKALDGRPNFESAQFQWTGREPIGIGNAFPHTTKVPRLVIAPGHAETDDTLVVYGIVKYRDIFGKARSTTVGYRITSDRRLERLAEYAAYNESR